MRKIILLFAAFVVNSAFAQWFGGYSANVMYDPCVQASIAVAQSSNRIMQTNQMLMQQQQMMINNGWFNNGYSNINSSVGSERSTDSQSKGRYKETYEKCDNCDGQGYITRKVWMGGSEVRDVKRRCGYCYGRKKIRKSTYVVE